MSLNVLENKSYVDDVGYKVGDNMFYVYSKIYWDKWRRQVAMSYHKNTTTHKITRYTK